MTDSKSLSLSAFVSLFDSLSLKQQEEIIHYIKEKIDPVTVFEKCVVHCDSLCQKLNLHFDLDPGIVRDMIFEGEFFNIPILNDYCDRVMYVYLSPKYIFVYNEVFSSPEEEEKGKKKTKYARIPWNKIDAFIEKIPNVLPETFTKEEDIPIDYFYERVLDIADTVGEFQGIHQHWISIKDVQFIM